MTTTTLDPEVEWANPLPQPRQYADIVEIIEAGRRGCNFYLEHGYELLRIDITTRQRFRADKTEWTRRDHTYVLGRPRMVGHCDPPRPEPKAEAAPESA